MIDIETKSGNRKTHALVSQKVRVFFLIFSKLTETHGQCMPQEVFYYVTK